jgi:hypothetical protein
MSSGRSDQTPEAKPGETPSSFLRVSTLDTAFEHDRKLAQHQDLALLMGRPIAGAGDGRSSVAGRPAISGMECVSTGSGSSAETNDFDTVSFPIR